MPLLMTPLFLWGGSIAAVGFVGFRTLGTEEPKSEEAEEERDLLGFCVSPGYKQTIERLERERESEEYRAWARQLVEHFGEKRGKIPPSLSNVACFSSSYSGKREALPCSIVLIAKGGVPHALRPAFWMEVTAGCRQRLRNCSSQSESSPLEQRAWEIQKDVPRTLPGCRLFEQDGGEGQERLRGVLMRFAEGYKHGYAQSMNVLTAFLISSGCTDDESLALLRTIVQGERYSLDYYTDCRMSSPGLKQCRIDLTMFERVLNHHTPALLSLFHDQSVSPCFVICLQWLLCAFVDAVQTEYSLIIFDLFMVEGLPVLLNIALLILKRYEADVVGMTCVQEAVETIRARLKRDHDLTDLLVAAVSPGEGRVFTHDNIPVLRRISMQLDELCERAEQEGAMVAESEEQARQELVMNAPSTPPFSCNSSVSSECITNDSPHASPKQGCDYLAAAIHTRQLMAEA